MSEEIEGQWARWVQMLIDCPKRAIHFGPGPILVDPTADLSTEAFWAWMEQWFGGRDDQGGTDMLYGSRREVLLRVQEPSVGMIQLGKIARRLQDLKWGYMNNISAAMRKTGEFAVAPCVVELMRAWGLELVMYWDPKTGTTFQTNIYTLLSEGRLVSYSYRPQYWHLAMGKWPAVNKRLRTTRTEDVLLLEWSNQAEAQVLRPKKQAREVQLALF